MIFGALIVGGLVGSLSEYFGLTRNGYVVSIAIGLGGAMIFWLAQWMFGIGFGLSRGLTAGLGAVLLLFVASLRK